MNKLLNDNELRDKVSRFAYYFNEMGEAEPGQDGWYMDFDKKLDELLDLIQSQKQAHEDMVIGKDDRGETPKLVHRNELRAEQRERSRNAKP